MAQTIIVYHFCTGKQVLFTWIETDCGYTRSGNTSVKLPHITSVEINHMKDIWI